MLKRDRKIMNLNKIINDFVDDYLKGNPLAPREEITQLVLDVNRIVEGNKDVTACGND